MSFSPANTPPGRADRSSQEPKSCLTSLLDDCTRHPMLWFSDGSIILHAERTLFRVHISQLSRHSAFFRDLFSLPQPPTSSVDHSPSSSFLDGCPVLQLYDSPEDLSNLLMAMYDGPSFGDNGRNDFHVVAGILRLSSKYVIDKLHRKALAHLSIAWPSTLKGWDAREDRARSSESEEGVVRGHLYPSPIDVINLAREIGANPLLVPAFYDLSRYHYTQIFEPVEEDPLYPSDPSHTLSPRDIQKLTLGKESSSQFITSLIQSMTAPPGGPPPSFTLSLSRGHSPRRQSTVATHRRGTSSKPVCTSAAACRNDFSELVDLATQHYLFDREKGCTDPLYVAEELGQLKSADFSECTACAKSLEHWASRERERIWKLIPVWFRLEEA